jgi:hypothetical protein
MGVIEKVRQSQSQTPSRLQRKTREKKVEVA